MALTKVFRIELTGGKDVEKDLTAIRKTMASMATAIVKAKGELAALLTSKADPAAITNLTKKIADLEAKLKSLGQERKKAEADAKTQARTEDILASAKLKNEKADKEAAKAAQIRIDTQISQNKELDRQIDREKKETEQLKKKKKELDGLPGSYNALKKSAQELYAELKKANSSSTVTTASGKSFSYDQAIAEYKRLSAAEQDFRRQFVKDGTLVGEYASGIVDAFKRLNIDDIIKNQVTGAKEQISQLEKKTNELTVAYRQAQQQGSQDLNKLEKEIHDNVVETERLKKSVKETEVQLKGIGGVGEQITGSINKGFKELKNSAGQLLLTYVGFQALFSGIQSGVDNAKKLSDQTTDLEINMGKAKDGADGLVSSLKGLDTRTNLSGLEEISNVALKAGTTEQNLLGVTKAIDTVKIAFGNDFGSIEQGTETFVKLINIFYDDGQVTEDRILKIGNSIRTLANETVASVPFINDFAGRMAGLRQVANVSLPQIVGLGAGFEEFKQSAEVSSTVLVKVIPQLARDIDTFAGIAGKSREEFKKLLQENPIEALLQVSQGLTAGKGDIEVFSNTLKDAGIDAGRAVSIISTLGGKADIFRDRIAKAGVAIQSTDAITDAFNRKNENLAATMDKITKKFADVAGSKGFQTTLLAIATGITFLLNNIPALLVLLGLLTANWAAQNAQLILLRAQVLGYNIAIGASYVAMGALTIAQTAYNTITFITTTAITLATRALAFFGITIRATTGPLSIILTLIGLLAAAYVAFGRHMEVARNNLSEFTRLQRINAEINREAIKNTSDQIAALDGWVAVIKSAATSADTKRKALEKLIEINPAFRSALKGQAIDLNELNLAYSKVVQAIQAKARAEAAATLSAGRQKKVTEIAGLRQDLEIQFAQDRSGQSVTNVELTDDQIEFLKKTNLQSAGAILNIYNNRVTILRQRFDEVKKVLDKKEKEAIGIYQDYLKAQALAEENLTKAEEQVQKAPALQVTETVFQIFDRLVANNGTGADFKELLKKIQEQKKSTDVLSKEYKDLLALEAKVKELLKPKTGGSGRERSPHKEELDNRLKEIEAAITDRKNELDEQLADGLISERDYYVQVRDNTISGEQQKIDIILEYQQKYKKELARFNGELLKEVSDAEKKQIQAKNDARRKLFEAENKQLDINLRNEQSAASRDKDLILTNPELSNEDRIQATIDYFDRLLRAQIVYNQKQIELEKKYSIVSIENAQKRKEEIEKINKEIAESERQRPEAQIKDIQDAGDRQIREYNIYYANLRKSILENTRITEKERKRQLEELDKSQRRTILSAELAALNIEVKKLDELLKKGLISRAQYLKAVEAQQKKAEELAGETGKTLDTFDASISGFIESLSNLAGLGDLAQKEIGKSGISVGFVVAQSWDLAKTALQGYWQERLNVIEREKQEKLDELDREKERVKGRAASKAEEEAIERQFAQRKRQIEKEAGEQVKKQKKAEARVALAAELANIAVQAAANPANAISFGAAGLTQFAILSALALGRYILRVSEINKAQFGFGGYLKKKLFGFGGKAGEVPTSGGVFGGRPHSQGGTDFDFGGQSYNAEAGELSIIRTRNAPKNGVYSITGSQAQIASALNKIGGGINFASGANVKKFAMGGAIGSKLKAPYFSAGAYLNGGNVANHNNDDRIERLEAMTEQVLAAVYSSDAKPVILVPDNVTKAQRKKVKDTSVGDI